MISGDSGQDNPVMKKFFSKISVEDPEGSGLRESGEFSGFRGFGGFRGFRWFMGL